MTLYANFADVPAAKWRWPDFQPSEIACRRTGKLLVNERALDMLQELRTRLGKPIHVNSGYRSPEHNRAVGGARNSKHLEGIAFDCRMAGHDPQVFMATAKAVGFKGIGQYPVLGFCHVDAREDAASWLGSRGKKFPGPPAQPAPPRAATPKVAEAREVHPKPPTSPRAPITVETPKAPPGLLAVILRVLKSIFTSKGASK